LRKNMEKIAKMKEATGRKQRPKEKNKKRQQQITGSERWAAVLLCDNVWVRGAWSCVVVGRGGRVTEYGTVRKSAWKGVRWCAG